MAQFRQTAGRVVAFVGWAWVAAMMSMETWGCVVVYQRYGFWTLKEVIYETTSPFGIYTWVRIVLYYLPGFALVAWGRKLRKL